MQRDCGRPPVPRKDPGSKPEEEPLLSDHPYVDKVFFLQGILFLRSHYIINVVIHLFSIETKGHMHTYKRNAMSTTFSQQILSGRLLLVGQKSHFNGRFKL